LASMTMNHSMCRVVSRSVQVKGLLCIYFKEGRHIVDSTKG